MAKKTAPPPMTAATLCERAMALTNACGPRAWIDTHPQRDAIITAIKNGASTVGVVRALRESGDREASVSRVTKVRERIRQGTL
jgi:hypothetical protein